MAARAEAQLVVTENRLNLPDGPGSLEGIGENVEVDPNMGVMRWNIPIQVPRGFPGVTPEPRLAYSSGNGGSVVGMGWTLDVPYIERMTFRGLPVYDRDDLFAADGGQQLVRVEEGPTPIYRARFERDFVRYTWHNPGSGGYWEAEYPDGRRGYFGADRFGAPVENARVSGSDGVFRYHVVEVVDVFGHRIRYDYTKDGQVALLEAIGYVFTDPSTPRYSVTFEYEDRNDILSDCKAGFNERLTSRMSAINVYSAVNRIRRYELSYEGYEVSGNFTRLSRVETIGLNGGTYPIVFDFEYSRALGALCDGSDCTEPYLVDMGSLGLDVAQGNAGLADLNGDALPDVVSSTLPGNHRIHLNVMEPEGTQYFDEPFTSAMADSAGSRLASDAVQLLDANGDGFVDLVHAATGVNLILENRGQGDWVSSSGIDTGDLPNLGENIANLRFLDWDNDKRIDVVVSADPQSTAYYQNMGEAHYEVSDGEPIGAGFEESGLQLEDMNGDGMMDVVRVAESQGESVVSCRLNLGWGRWEPWFEMTGAPEGLPQEFNFVDINGDALSDVVLVRGNAVQYALNFNGDSFLEVVELTSASGEALPERTSDVTVLFADMNGNGSEDVVWITRSGQVTYLELFPVRPNLLSRIENGIGMVTAVTYGTSVEHMARDGGAGSWAHPLPHPMIVVDRLDTWDELTGVHEITDFVYHDGFYDGVEKQYRGYANVEAHLLGDESIEPGLTLSEFDVGAQSPYYNGLLLRRETQSDGRDIRVETTTYDDCELAGVPDPGDLAFPVRFICRTEVETVLREGAPEAEWATIETRFDYDRYGNVVLESSLGVTRIGGSGCATCQRDSDVFGAPCGSECLGDELYTETTYVSPDNTGGRWMLRNPYRVRRYGIEGSDVFSEEMTYYDGDPFVGLPEGQLTEGLVSRVTARVEVGSTETIERERNRHDRHGNVIETLDALGAPGMDGHRRAYVYDEDGLRIEQVDVYLADAEGNPYQLRRNILYEPVFNNPVEATRWMRVEDAEVLTARDSTLYGYDEFGRIVSLAQPGGDTLDAPTESYAYELGNPVSRLGIRRRSQVRGPLDIEIVRCLDGRGRTVQERIRLSDSRHQISGFIVRNVRGTERRVYQPYLADSGACESNPPRDVLFTDFEYDATGRIRRAVFPDAQAYGTASVQETTYEPLATVAYDEEDTDPSSPHFDTPLITRTDGSGRTWALERYLEPNGPPALLELTYDELGRLRGYIDAAGNEKVQDFDLLGRAVLVDDPNAGVATYEYDAAGNPIAQTDARGVTVRTRYDGDNRPIQRWDDADRDGTLINWTYDRAEDCAQNLCTNTEGRLAAVVYPLDGRSDGIDLGGEHYGYDPRGRQIYRAQTLEDFTYEIRTVYDNADRLLSTTYPDGTAVARSYDAASRLVSIEGVIDGISYDERGLVYEIRVANGTESRRTYDDRMRLAALTTVGPGEGVLQGYDYRRDRVGNILERGDLRSPLPEGPSASSAYTYDAWYRLVEAELDEGREYEELLSYTYDDIDNLLSRTSSWGATSPANVGAYSYRGDERPNAVVQAGELEMTYDLAGNMTDRGMGTMSWDFLGRLTAVSRGEEILTSYVYGADETRVTKIEGESVTHYIGRDFEVRDGVSVVWVKIPIADRENRVARLETDNLAAAVLSDIAPIDEPDGRITVGDAWLAHAHADGILDVTTEMQSSPTQLTLSSIRRLLLEESYLHHDHLGSVTLATNRSGDVVGRTDYYPFGEPRATEGDLGRCGFTGQEIDEATGLLHFQFRYLDSGLGRWLSPDPLFRVATQDTIGRLGESTTAYAYVANSVINRFDPSGLAKRLNLQELATIHRWRAQRAARRGGLERRGAAPGAERARLTVERLRSADATARRQIGRLERRLVSLRAASRRYEILGARLSQTRLLWGKRRMQQHIRARIRMFDMMTALTLRDIAAIRHDFAHEAQRQRILLALE